MMTRNNRVNPSVLEVAMAEVVRLGDELDALEATEPWSDELEARRQDLIRRWAAAHRAVQALGDEAEDQESAP